MLNKSGVSLFLCFICAVNFMLFSLPSYAIEPNEEELEFLLFEEIPIVELASKKGESLADTPSTVRQYSQKDIESLGYYTLAELADITPGYSSYYIFGERVFETRGQKAGSWNNNRHILFIDGIPVHHARNYKVNTEWEMPLFFADSVEFLAGPASSLYGTGAFYGAVAIHSKDMDDTGTLIESKIFGSSVDSESALMTNIISNTETVQTKVFFSYYDKQASKTFTGPFDDAGTLLWDDQNSVFLYGSSVFKAGLLEGVSVGLIVNKKTGGMGEFWNGVHGGSNEVNEVIWQQVIPFLKYEQHLGDEHLFKSYLKYNASKEKSDYYTASVDNNITSYESNVDNYELLFELQSNLIWDMQSIIGFNFDTRDDDLESNGLAVVDVVGNVSTYSAYAQLKREFLVLSGLLTTCGFRYDKVNAEVPNFNFDKMTPRIALVQKIDESWRVKLSYGKAFRSPGIKEFGLNAEFESETAQDLAQLGPELIETIEGTISYYTKRFSGNLIFFKNTTTDIINSSSVRDSLGVTRNFFLNDSGELEGKGVEFDCRFAISDNFAFLFNFSQAKALDGNDVEFADVPTQKANFILLNHFDISLGTVKTALIYRWVDEFRVSDSALQKIDGGDVFDLNTILMLSDTTSLELNIRNIFDENYKFPKGNIADIPIPARSVIVRIKKTF